LSTTDIDIHEGIADDFESLANRSRPIPPHPGGGGGGGGGYPHIIVVAMTPPPKERRRTVAGAVAVRWAVSPGRDGTSNDADRRLSLGR